MCKKSQKLNKSQHFYIFQPYFSITQSSFFSLIQVQKNPALIFIKNIFCSLSIYFVYNLGKRLCVNSLSESQEANLKSLFQCISKFQVTSNSSHVFDIATQFQNTVVKKCLSSFLTQITKMSLGMRTGFCLDENQI